MTDLPEVDAYKRFGIEQNAPVTCENCKYQKSCRVWMAFITTPAPHMLGVPTELYGCTLGKRKEE